VLQDARVVQHVSDGAFKQLVFMFGVAAATAGAAVVWSYGLLVAGLVALVVAVLLAEGDEK
jgi:hypothetical protein